MQGGNQAVQPQKGMKVGKCKEHLLKTLPVGLI